MWSLILKMKKALQSFHKRCSVQRRSCKAFPRATTWRDLGFSNLRRCWSWPFILITLWWSPDCLMTAKKLNLTGKSTCSCGDHLYNVFFFFFFFFFFFLSDLNQVRQNQKRLFGLVARKRLSLSLPLSFSPSSYFLSFFLNTKKNL